MCGIAGIINQSGNSVEEKLIHQITDLVAHRGPDDSGYFLEANIAFGHRRLSIIDLSDNGHQPMHYLDKYVITYNGEIYNYIELREELKKQGYHFTSNTDTEVILASYDLWKENCVDHFNGMWAFAIYDKNKDIVFCSRDRFGIKPFYYTIVNDLLIFGSEIKQLLNFYSKKYANKNVLMDYLVIGIDDYTEETFFENIYRLKQSHNLTYDLKTNQYRIDKYYDIKFQPEISQLKFDDALELFKSETERSIKLRLRSDVKVGTCLSGGLDSSYIAAVASKLYSTDTNDQFCAITAKSIEKSKDETEYARIVVENSNLDWNIIEPQTEDFLKYLDKVILTQEEPFGTPSIFMQYFVMEKAKEAGCKVMLDGQGGDETLLGYERYYAAYLLSLPFHKVLPEFLNASKNSKLSKFDLLAYLAYFPFYGIRISRLRKKYNFFKPDYLSMISKNIIKTNAKKFTDIFELQRYEITETRLQHLLRYEDKNSMANSIETRLPFLDYKLVEFLLSINQSHKIHKGWTKYILRKATAEHLPKEISWRKTKIGFEAPLKKWLTNNQIILDQIQKSDIISKIASKNITEMKDLKSFWRIYNVAKWEELYEVEIS
ncbi:MAG: asparagine synthase (glutamine-hydrolyzing) [Bacteroidia bacterium]|nr:asparagine synthase (glutamine-hydrolyzing) [Bacteroidia bacterium]